MDTDIETLKFQKKNNADPVLISQSGTCPALRGILGFMGLTKLLTESPLESITI